MDDIKEVLKTDEAQEAINQAIKEATEGLKNKNDELLGSLRAEKDKRQELQNQIDEIKEAKQQAETEAAEKSGDIEKIKETLQSRHQKEMEKLQGKLQEKDGKLHSLLVDNGLSQSLSKVGVAPQHMDVVKAYIKSTHDAEVTDVDGKPVAHIDGTPLQDFVSEWSQGDQGKHYIAAPSNSGGGANGANGSGEAAGGQKMTRDQFNALDQRGRMEASRKGVKVTDDN